MDLAVSLGAAMLLSDWTGRQSLVKGDGGREGGREENGWGNEGGGLKRGEGVKERDGKAGFCCAPQTSPWTNSRVIASYRLGSGCISSKPRSGIYMEPHVSGFPGTPTSA